MDNSLQVQMENISNTKKIMNTILATEKNLIIDGKNEKYLELVNIYKYLLEYFIVSKINLLEYDNIIKSSELYIGSNSKYKGLNEYLDLNYIFLINHLFVEKLSTEDINNLFSKFDKNNIDNTLLDIINKTYKDVIYDNYLDGQYTDKIYKVCYGDVVPSNFVNNNSLVFRIYYGKNLIDLEGEKFKELHLNQLLFLNKIKDSIIKEVKEKLDLECEIIIEKDLY